MNKAVIYFGATGNEAADQMVMQVLEEYCTVFIRMLLKSLE